MRFILTVAFICTAIAMCSTSAYAVSVTVNGTQEFYDGFENGTPGVPETQLYPEDEYPYTWWTLASTPDAGNWLIHKWTNENWEIPQGDWELTPSAQYPAPPHAYEGNQSFVQYRETDPWCECGAMFESGTAYPCAGTTVHAEFMLYMDSATNNWPNWGFGDREWLYGYFASSMGDFTVHGTDVFYGKQERTWEWVDTGLDVIDNSWNQIEVDWDGYNMTITVNGESAPAGVVGTQSGTFDRMLFETALPSTIYYLDATTDTPNTIPGDANLDHVVDEDDAAILAAHWLSSGVWVTGDFNGDGFVDDADATIMASNWQAGSAAVPEPSVLAMLAAGLLVMLIAKRKR